jgi:hypothetical protein
LDKRDKQKQNLFSWPCYWYSWPDGSYVNEGARWAPQFTLTNSAVEAAISQSGLFCHFSVCSTWWWQSSVTR